MLDGKKMQQPPKQSDFFYRPSVTFLFFWMSHCVACHPAGQILYHVTASCKGPIEVLIMFETGLVGYFLLKLVSPRLAVT